MPLPEVAWEGVTGGMAVSGCRGLICRVEVMMGRDVISRGWKRFEGDGGAEGRWRRLKGASYCGFRLAVGMDGRTLE